MEENELTAMARVLYAIEEPEALVSFDELSEASRRDYRRRAQQEFGSDKDD